MPTTMRSRGTKGLRTDFARRIIRSVASHVLVATAFGTTLTRFAGLSVNTGLARASMGIVQIARQRVFSVTAYVQKVSVCD